MNNKPLPAPSELPQHFEVRFQKTVAAIRAVYEPEVADNNFPVEIGKFEISIIDPSFQQWISNQTLKKKWNVQNNADVWELFQAYLSEQISIVIAPQNTCLSSYLRHVSRAVALACEESLESVTTVTKSDVRQAIGRKNFAERTCKYRKTGIDNAEIWDRLSFLLSQKGLRLNKTDKTKESLLEQVDPPDLTPPEIDLSALPSMVPVGSAHFHRTRRVQAIQDRCEKESRTEVDPLWIAQNTDFTPYANRVQSRQGQSLKDSWATLEEDLAQQKIMLQRPESPDAYYQQLIDLLTQQAKKRGETTLRIYNLHDPEYQNIAHLVEAIRSITFLSARQIVAASPEPILQGPENSGKGAKNIYHYLPGVVDTCSAQGLTEVTKDWLRDNCPAFYKWIQSSVHSCGWDTVREELEVEGITILSKKSPTENLQTKIEEGLEKNPQLLWSPALLQELSDSDSVSLRNQIRCPQGLRWKQILRTLPKELQQRFFLKRMPPKELTKKYPAEARLYTEPKKRLLIRHLELCLQFAAQTPSGPARTSQPAAVSIPKPTPAEIKSLNKTGNCIYRNITKLIKETSLCWDDFLSAISEETLRGYAQAQKNRSPHFPPSEVPQDLLIKTPPLPSQLLKKKKPKKAAKTSKGTKPMLSKAAPQKTPRAKPITKKQYLDENCPEAALWGDSSGRRKKGEWFEEAPDALSDIFDDDALAAVRGW